MEIKKLVVHHSASPRVTTKKSDIELWHTQRGFSQIGYHKVIEGDGKIVVGRPEDIQGAHAKGANSDSLGVCVVGDFEKEIPTQSQIDSLVLVLVEWCKKYSLTSSNIYGHFNAPGGTTSTSCPGANLKSLLSTVKPKVEVGLSKP